mmetsp:Transcript_88330/g.248790  ORF Transcript_88330/g.248790 Transcript_88330/m.248790 type:complete len:207 (-) Transcript_88330:54-674(-)
MAYLCPFFVGDADAIATNAAAALPDLHRALKHRGGRGGAASIDLKRGIWARMPLQLHEVPSPKALWCDGRRGHGHPCLCRTRFGGAGLPGCRQILQDCDGLKDLEIRDKMLIFLVEAIALLQYVTPWVEMQFVSTEFAQVEGEVVFQSYTLDRARRRIILSGCLQRGLEPSPDAATRGTCSVVVRRLVDSPFIGASEFHPARDKLE